MENQAWVEPQPGEPVHPGTGEQGHIHMFTCFPLNQRVTADIIEFDVSIHLHNFPGTPLALVARPYLLGENRTISPSHKEFPLPEGCESNDCTAWAHIEYDLTELEWSGWTHFQLVYKVRLEDGTTEWYNVNRWPFFVDNGKPVSVATTPERLRRLGGDTWIGQATESNYSEAYIDRGDYPWDETTGKLIPLSGTWNLDVNFCCSHNNDFTTGFATIDPLLHAMPEPDLGTIVYEGPAGENIPLKIDTKMLEDGEHRLLLSACNPRATDIFTQCGVLVIRFLVDNSGAPKDARFVDIDHSIFQTAINWLAEQGITKGCNPPGNDRFCPGDSVTRGQMAAFLHRALDDVLAPTSPVEFIDDNESIFEADIEWLGATGVTKGCNPPANDLFCPNDSVTRGQMAAFLHRSLDDVLAPTSPVEFIDDDVSTFEADIEWLGATGVTKGCNPPVNDLFCPNDFVTREQMAAFMYRALAGE